MKKGKTKNAGLNFVDFGGNASGGAKTKKKAKKAKKKGGAKAQIDFTDLFGDKYIFD